MPLAGEDESPSRNSGGGCGRALDVAGETSPLQRRRHLGMPHVVVATSELLRDDGEKAEGERRIGGGWFRHWILFREEEKAS